MKTNHVNQADQKQALSWWNSLPGGKKRYLKEHTKLGTPEKIIRYWLANIKVNCIQVNPVIYSGVPGQLQPKFGRAERIVIDDSIENFLIDKSGN